MFRHSECVFHNSAKAGGLRRLTETCNDSNNLHTVRSTTEWMVAMDSMPEIMRERNIKQKQAMHRSQHQYCSETKLLRRDRTLWRDKTL